MKAEIEHYPGLREYILFDKRKKQANIPMIARIWHGKTKKSKSEEYKRFVLDVAVKDYESVEGLIGLEFLHRLEGEQAHFTLITFWPSIESIKKFAGEDFEKAKYYPEDKEFLLEFEESVTHYDVFYKELIN